MRTAPRASGRGVGRGEQDVAADEEVGHGGTRYPAGASVLVWMRLGDGPEIAIWSDFI